MAVLDDIEFARGVAAMRDQQQAAAEGARYWRGLAEAVRRRAELDEQRRAAMHREYARRSRARRRRR